MAFSVHRLAIDRAVDFAEPFLLRSHDSPPSSAAHPLVQYAKTPSPRTRPIRFRRSQRRQCYVIRYMIISVSADQTLTENRQIGESMASGLSLPQPRRPNLAYVGLGWWGNQLAEA